MISGSSKSRAPAAIVRHRLPAGFFTLVTALGLGLMVWMLREPGWATLRHHPYFAVTDVTVSGAGPLLTTGAVRDWLGMDGSISAWETSPVEIRARLEDHPMIAQAAVRRQLPRRIGIRIRERRPVAIVALDRLYYVDRHADIFSPLVSGRSHDYPVITGLTADTPAGYREWALRRALHLLRWCGRRLCFGGVSEVHLHPERGVVLYPNAPRVPVVLGWGSWPEKLTRAMRAVQVWHGAPERLASIDVRFRNQVIATVGAQPVGGSDG